MCTPVQFQRTDNADWPQPLALFQRILSCSQNEPAKECRYRAKHYQTSNYWPAVHTLFEQLLQTVLLFLFFFFIWWSVIINATTLHEHPIKTQGIDHVIAKLILLMCHHLDSTSQHCDKRNSSEMEEGGMGNMKKVTENYKSQNHFGF